jgi:hypothetical protein
VSINIERYSTPDERQALVEAFQQAGSEGLFNALEKMRSKGRMAIAGTLGYDIQLRSKDSDRHRLQDPHPDQSSDPIRRGLGEWTLN